jgi:7,8-dihydropterin-6-yl-methyl-4-(beta-D-ribofuranosyl)aminobenzene 5'-phosphate synthase
MKVTIIYDNKVYKRGIGLKSDWGFSCLIETKNNIVLFDTGANGEILLNNLKKLNIDSVNINKIVISHNHRDHMGGLESLVSYLNKIDLYQLGQNNINNKMNLANAENPKEICKDIWITGRIKGLVDEQSLVLNSEIGWFVITGCSHPGVEKILKRAEQIAYCNIVGIVGGFHGFNRFSILEDFQYICPCHCTAHKQDLKRAFPNVVYNCGVGKTIDLNVKK